MHPLQAADRIRADYARYLQTIYAFRDLELRTAFAQALSEPEFLLKGPIVQATPPYEPGASIADLVAEGVLHATFRHLCSDALPLARPLYQHQETAIRKAVAQSRNLAIATGTGSGKTESFLVPILHHLLEQQERGELDRSGVRALLLYPMNALANDQLRRLRRILERFPEITFGRYTGETAEGEAEAEERFAAQFPQDPRLPNELISRSQLRATPPHILLTNYAMLEYLLLRPTDSEFFDGPTGRFWRFVVMDEAHVYDGAQGIEVALLLRRLKDRVVRSEPGRLRCFATSATLGRGVADYPAVAAFAEQLFGEPFDWRADDEAHQDVVGASFSDWTQRVNHMWGEGTAPLYKQVRTAVDSGDARGLAALAQRHGIAVEPPGAGWPPAGSERAQAAVAKQLWSILSGDQNLVTLQSKLAVPLPMQELCANMEREAGLDQAATIALIELASKARLDAVSAPLLPARYHTFVRALEGAFLCLNRDHEAHRVDSLQRLFLARHETCEYCGSRVFELASCTRCGMTYVVARQIRAEDGDAYLQPAGSDESEAPDTYYYVLDPAASRPDEDDAVVMGDDTWLEAHEETESITVCLRCGRIDDAGVQRCACGGETSQLYRVVTDGKRLRRCLHCGYSNDDKPAHRFLTGKDAPVAVVATSLYQLLEARSDLIGADLPGGGRKLLSFADSRQDAAFFAHYLERTYRRILQRALVLRTLTTDPDGVRGRLRLSDIVPRMIAAAEENTFFELEQSFDERQRLCQVWLTQELVALDSRMSLEGLGLVRVRLVRPPRWQPPRALTVAPWHLSADEAWDLIAGLLDTLRQQGAVTFPDLVDVRDAAFEPRNMPLYVRECAEPKAHVFGWAPKGTSHSNRRLDYVVRVLQRRSDLSSADASKQGLEALAGIWRAVTTAGGPWQGYLISENLRGVGTAYRLNHKLYEWRPSDSETALYRCDRCGALAHFEIAGVCPTYRCDGTLRRTQMGGTSDNHYQHLYRSLALIPMEAQEHTAQWRPEEAAKIQSLFVSGQVNILSCSTTFELGVDVGDLDTVLLRNVPPTTANYVQRAGRAGRRAGTVPFVLTFAQRRSHDLSFYRDPIRMVSGHVRPPIISVENERIARRHVQAVLVASFFRELTTAEGVWRRSVGEFFATAEGRVDAPAELRRYAQARPAEVGDALQRIITSRELRESLELDDWGWVAKLTDTEGNGTFDLAQREVSNDLETYGGMIAEAVASRHFSEAARLDRVIKTVRGRELIGYLGSHNVLPKYGFPTDVVPLRTEHVAQQESTLVQLERDLRMAVSEYAPGSEVVAAKKLWRSDGLYKLPGKSWQTYYYAVCKECGRFHRDLAAAPQVCAACGAALSTPGTQRGCYLWPEFGFVAAREVGEPGQSPPQRSFASRVFFAEYEDQVVPEVLHHGDLGGDRIQVLSQRSRSGLMAVVNDGIGHAGFRVCETCGHAEQVPLDRKRERGHNNPRTGQACKGNLKGYHLGHQFATDVLAVRLEGLPFVTSAGDAALSVLYALLEGAADLLGIPRDDLGATLYPHAAGAMPALMLYDDVPGGAGHVERVQSRLADVFHAALERTVSCECGPETSCYQCLRGYRNQWCHEQLRRGVAAGILKEVCG